MNQPDALRASGEAFELWQQDRLPEAEARYREAMAQADPRHYRTPDIRSQYAGVLTRLNRRAEAEALWLSGSVAEARAAAQRALSLASNVEQRERIRAGCRKRLTAPTPARTCAS
jgi:hypothetical protein